MFTRQNRWKIIVILGIIFLSGCASFTEYGKNYSSAQRYYEKGNYYESVYLLIRSLRIKPDYKKASELLNQSLPVFYDRHLKNVREYERQKNWDEVANEYNKIYEIATDVSHLKGNYQVVDVGKERETALKNAAEGHYQKGLSLMKHSKNKEAAKEFSKCKNFIPDYKDSLSLYEKCRKEALQRITIIPFENVTGKMWFEDVGSLISDQILDNCFKRNPEFIEFVTREYLNRILEEQKISASGIIESEKAVEFGKVCGIKYFVLGKINSIVREYPPVKARTEKVSKKIDKREGNKIIGEIEVSATVNYYIKEGRVEVRTSYQIIDVEKGSIVKTGSFSKKKEDIVEWARYSGDERALNYKQEELVKRDEATPKAQEVLIHQAIEDLSGDIAREIVGFFE